LTDGLRHARPAGPGPVVEHRPGLGHRGVDVCPGGVGHLSDHLSRRRVQDIADGTRDRRRPRLPTSSSSFSLVAVMFAPHLAAEAICPRYASKSANPAGGVLTAAELFLSWRALFPIGMFRA
jgi:hypothetical protein